MENARYQVGLNDFEYKARLHIEHPKLDPDVVTATLKIAPMRFHRAGDPRVTPGGRPLPGTYPLGYWCADLETRNGEGIDEFLSHIADELAPAQELRRRIVDEQGSVECFIGLFATRCCDQLLSSELLLRLGQLGVRLRLDYYGQVAGNKYESDDVDDAEHSS